MAYQKAYNAVVLLLMLFFFFGCKKLSKEYTTARWEIINPVTNTPYVGIPVRLILADYRGNSPKYETIWEGKTNSQGIAEYKFKGYTNPSFGYLEEAGLTSLGTLGFDYAIVRRPYAGSRPLDELNELRYEIVPYAKYIVHIKNVDCQNSNDKMRYRSNNLYTQPNNGFSNWSPNPNLNSGFFEGCFEFVSPLRTNPSDTVIYELEVTKGGNIELMTIKFFRDPSKIDTLKLYY